MSDPRIDIIRRAETAHQFVSAGVKTDTRPMHWRCRCGENYEGDGAIEFGRRHVAEQILAALDYAENRKAVSR